MLSLPRPETLTKLIWTDLCAKLVIAKRKLITTVESLLSMTRTKMGVSRKVRCTALSRSFGDLMIVDSPRHTGKQSMAMTPEGRASVWRTSRLAGSGLIGKPSSLQQDTRTTTTTLPSPRPMILEGRCTLSLRVSDPSGELGPNMKGTTTRRTVKKSSQSNLTLKGSSTPPKTSGKSTLARMVRPKSPSLRTSAQSSGNCLWTRTGQTSTGRGATLTTLPTRVSASKTSSTAGSSGT